MKHTWAKALRYKQVFMRVWLKICLRREAHRKQKCSHHQKLFVWQHGGSRSSHHRDTSADPVTYLQQLISICPFPEQRGMCMLVKSNSLFNPQIDGKLPNYFIPLKKGSHHMQHGAVKSQHTQGQLPPKTGTSLVPAP